MRLGSVPSRVASIFGPHRFLGTSLPDSRLSTASDGERARQSRVTQGHLEMGEAGMGSGRKKINIVREVLGHAQCG